MVSVLFKCDGGKGGRASSALKKGEMILSGLSQGNIIISIETDC